MAQCEMPINYPVADEALGRAIVGNADLPTIEEDTGRLGNNFRHRNDDLSDHAPVTDSDETVRSSDDPVDLEDGYFWTQFLIDDANHLMRQFPSLRYINQGVLLCDTQVEKGKMADADATYFQYSFPAGTRNLDMVADSDILGNFDESRIPPRSAFRMDAARKAVGKEIADLSKVEKGTSPSMIEIRLGDAKHRHLPRIPSTMVVKRKSPGLYKGRLCTTGDIVPLSVTGFVSSPTVRRSSIKIGCALAAALRWDIRALDISQAFTQSGNLRHESRLVVTPPPMAALPWKGSFPRMGADLENLPRTHRGFLLLRPLYGGRGAPNALVGNDVRTVAHPWAHAIAHRCMHFRPIQWALSATGVGNFPCGLHFAPGKSFGATS